MTVITRFAPSPTGFLHLGGARTALFAWIFAKQNNGKFILRIEDTDIVRHNDDAVTGILDALHWLDIDYIPPLYYQSQRLSIYQAAIQQLIADGFAYYCYCSKERLAALREQQKATGLKPRYDRHCLSLPSAANHDSPVVRFKNPSSGVVSWQDMIKGQITIANAELDDLIIARSDGMPTYNLCVAVDDLAMHITHVIRGDDHVSNTPRQINLIRALNAQAQIPQYAHLPMILDMSGQKLSKRRDAVDVNYYRELGILPTALLNYLARLCWGYHDAEIFAMTQFQQWFDLTNVSSAAARFDMQKLLWVNAQHLHNMDNTALCDMIHTAATNTNSNSKGYDMIDLSAVVAIQQQRVQTITELIAAVNIFYQPMAITADNLHYFNHSIMLAIQHCAQELLDITWDKEHIQAVIKRCCADYHLKLPQLAMPLRLLLCGCTKTPAIDQVLLLLGKQITYSRINARIADISIS